MTATEKKMKELKGVISDFDKSLNLEQFQKAANIYTELKKEGISDQNMEAQYDVVTPIKDGFSAFPQLKSNDISVEQLDYLEAA